MWGNIDIRPVQRYNLPPSPQPLSSGGPQVPDPTIAAKNQSDLEKLLGELTSRVEVHTSLCFLHDLYVKNHHVTGKHRTKQHAKMNHVTRSFIT